MPRASATFRLAAFYGLAFAAITLVLGVAIYGALRSEFRADLDHRIVAERDALLGESGSQPDRLAPLVDALPQLSEQPA